MRVEQYETISVERNGAVDTLWLNRPDAMNAITTPMVTELRHYFDLAGNERTRVVLMGGRGKAFCAGLISRLPVIHPCLDPLVQVWAFRLFGRGVCPDASLSAADHQHDSRTSLWRRFRVCFGQ